MVAAEGLNAGQVSAAPRIALPGARQIARSIYGWSGEPVALNGEIDRNFRVGDGCGRFGVLKISHAGELPAIELQNAVLGHLADVDPDCLVPRLICGLDGAPVARIEDEVGNRCCVRLLTYVEGRPLETAGDAVDFASFGRAMARLDLALASFPGTVTAQSGPWDLLSAHNLIDRLGFIEDREDRKRAERAFTRFEPLREAFLGLPRQLVHNDLNPHNVIVTGETGDLGFGFIDFGDAVRAPVVAEVAIAGAYHLRQEGDPLARVAALVRGYEAVSPLGAEAHELLPALLGVRMAQSLTISAWRAARSPANRDYLLRYRDFNSRALARLAEIGPGPALLRS